MKNLPNLHGRMRRKFNTKSNLLKLMLLMLAKLMTKRKPRGWYLTMKFDASVTIICVRTRISIWIISEEDFYLAEKECRIMTFSEMPGYIFGFRSPHMSAADLI